MTEFVPDPEQPTYKRILICGSRTYTNTEAIARYVNSLEAGVTVIHGGAIGADSIAGEIAERRAMKVEVYLPDWDGLGKKAGFVRNQEMIDEGKPDLVVYFTNDLSVSKGTSDMVKRAISAKIDVLDGENEDRRIWFYKIDDRTEQS